MSLVLLARGFFDETGELVVVVLKQAEDSESLLLTSVLWHKIKAYYHTSSLLVS